MKASSSLRKVRFQTGNEGPREYFSDLTKEEIRSLWYTNEELQASRDEARFSVQLLNQTGLSILKDNSVAVLFRGIEKYHQSICNILRRQNLVQLVLLQQALLRLVGIMDNGDRLALISREQSKIGTDFALLSAHMSSNVSFEASQSVSNQLSLPSKKRSTIEAGTLHPGAKRLKLAVTSLAS